MNVSIIVFPGSNCDLDIFNSILSITNIKPKLIWYDDYIPKNTDFIIIPGGFSFGDYLRSGAIASTSKIIKQVYQLSKKGLPILGICNGFQILTEAKLLPGTLIMNKNLKFVCKEVKLKIINNTSIFTKKINDEVIELPIAHRMGNYTISNEELNEVINKDQIAFKYCSSQGKCDEQSNPNGSIQNIAGILSKNKRVLGMMPHPERFKSLRSKDVIMRKIIRSMIC